MTIHNPISDREQHGDTYEKYRRRCYVNGITPSEFQEWLKFELAATTRRGPHPTLDAQQRAETMVLAQ
jgi:hypothetical protein